MRAPIARLREHRVEDLAAHVVEVDVDAVGAQLHEAGGDVLGPVVDARVEAELVDDPAALVVGARDADDRRRALELRELSGDRADATGGAGHHEGLAGLRARTRPRSPNHAVMPVPP